MGALRGADGRRADWERRFEARPARYRPGVDVASHLPGQAARAGEAEPEAGARPPGAAAREGAGDPDAAPRPPAALEAPEDPLALGVGDPGPVVDHAQARAV